MILESTASLVHPDGSRPLSSGAAHHEATPFEQRAHGHFFSARQTSDFSPTGVNATNSQTRPMLTGKTWRRWPPGVDPKLLIFAEKEHRA